MLPNRQVLRQLAVAFLLVLLPVILFVELSSDVREKDTLYFDEAVLHRINALSSSGFDTAATLLTRLGGPLVVMVATSVIAGVFWGRKQYRRLVFLVAAVGGSALLNLVLKALFQRDRPQLWERLVTENSFSFPSGHAMASFALGVALVIVFWPTRLRYIVLVCASVYIVAIAFTRLYLGVHYPTDIVAGWLVSGAWITIVVYILHNWRRIARYFRHV